MSENTLPNDSTDFVITRSFNAPIEKVWLAWSEEENMAQWWGPKGFDLEVLHFDFEPGGTFHYSMTAGKNVMWGLFTYEEMVAPNRIVFINSFSDPQGNITRAPFFDDKWPLQIRNVMTMEEQDDPPNEVTGKPTKITTITLRGGPINATPEEMAAFQSNKASMNQGFGGTWDKLDAFLAQEGPAYNSMEAKFEPSADSGSEM